MNDVGSRMVRDILISSVENETGNISLPNILDLPIGVPLPGGGPYITGVSVNIGEEGVTTSYRYGKWALKTGKMSSYQVERYKRFYQMQRDQKRSLRDLYGGYSQNLEILSRGGSRQERRRPRREKPNSASAMIMGESLFNEDNSQVISQVAMMPYYNVGQLLNEDFYKKSGMSMDGLFRPYQVGGSGEDLPKYILTDAPASGEPFEVNSLNLFPFSSGHDVSVVFRGDKPSEDIKNDVFAISGEYGSNEFRPMALKGPLVVAAWGYDIDDKPVPNSNEDEPTDEFLEDYLQKYNEWKVGPVDLRWDEDRKLWATGDSLKLIEGELTSPIYAASAIDSPTQFTMQPIGTTDSIICHNRDRSLEVSNYQGIFVIVSKIKDQYRPIWVGCE